MEGGFDSSEDVVVRVKKIVQVIFLNIGLCQIYPFSARQIRLVQIYIWRAASLPDPTQHKCAYHFN